MTIQLQLHPKTDTILETLKNKSKLVVNQFRNNNMIVNPDKFQLILLQKSTIKINSRKTLIQ